MSSYATLRLRRGAVIGLALLLLASGSLADPAYLDVKKQLREYSFIVIDQDGEQRVLFIGAGALQPGLQGLADEPQIDESLYSVTAADAHGRIDRLAAALHDPSRNVRLSAIRLLGELDIEEARMALESMLAHPDPPTRLEVVDAIADTDGAESLLRHATASDDPAVATTAAEYLAERPGAN